MDFSITDDQASLQDLAREILADRVTHEHLSALEAQSWSVFDRDLWQRLADAGVAGIAIPEEHDGGGLGFLEVTLVLEQVGRVVAPVPAVQTLATSYVLGRFAPASFAATALPGVAGGARLLTTTLEGAGEVTARRDGVGWRLTGERGFVPYGEYADVLVPATSEAGPVLALVPVGTPGVTVTPLETTNREPQALLAFEDVAVGAEAVVEDATDLILALERHLTAALCAVASGVCQAALAMTAAHTRSREQFGKPIASFQAVGQRAADAYIDATMVELTARQAAWRLSEGWPAEEEVAVAKFWAGDGGMRALHSCQHLHGGLGVDLDYPLHRYFLWGKQLEHELGTPTRQLLDLGRLLAATPV